MKKRLLSALLALALVFVLLPTTALADSFDPDITIAGTKYDFQLEDYKTNTYAKVYYQHGKFLTKFEYTQDGVWATDPYLELTKTGAGNDTTITVTVHKGSNTTKAFEIESAETCIATSSSYWNLVITGSGALNLVHTGTSAAIWSNHCNITITGGVTVNVKGTKSGSNINSYSNAIQCGKTFTVSNGATVVAENNSTYSNGPAVKTEKLIVSGDAKFEAQSAYGGKAISFDSITADGYDFMGRSANYGAYTTLTGEDKATKLQEYRSIKITPTVIQKDNYVYIAGEKAVVGQWTTITADSCSGSYYYDADKKELTLKDVNITRNNNNVNHAIQFTKNGDYTINLEGANNISSVTNGICALNKAFYDNPANISVTITGTGSLNVIANTYAIDMQVGNLIFNNTGNITLTTNTNYKVPSTVCNALRVKPGSITIDNTKYDIVGARQEKNYPTETISDSSVFDPAYLNGYTVGGETTLFKTITITPAAAKDSTIRYNGTTLKQGETIKDGKGGTATVATNGNTITLNNFKGTKALSFEATLADSTLVLEGTNTLSSIVTTQKGLTISDSGSLTVGSIRVPNNTQNTANLTINGGAHVTVNRPSSEDKPAVEVSGNLTVTGDGTQLSAECTAATNPAIQVGGNASFTGSTVTITNHSTALHKDAAGSTKGDSVSSALYVKGNINTDNANVTAKVENGGGNAIGALGNITVNGSNVTAVNKGQKFTTIIAENVYVSGDSKITANNLNKNPPHNGSYLAFPAIEGKIVNQNTDYSLKFEGQHSRTSVPKTTLAPGEQTTLYYYNVTITRGDKVVRTPSPVDIDGHTLLNDTYYTITNDSTVVANGSESNYNAFYDSETKTLKLNDAQISTTTNNAAIEISEDLTITVTGTNELKGNYNHCIESDNNFKINGTGRLVMTNGSNTAASVIYCGPYKNLTIAAEVIIKNEAQPGYLIHIDKKDAYSFAEGYNVYASTNISGSPLEVYNPENYSAYKYLRVTKETLETGGGSTHEHVWDEAWHDTGDYHHAHQCTICKAYDTTTQESHNVTGHRDNHDGSHSNICGSCGYSAKVSHSYTWTPNANDNEKHIGTCVCGNVVERYHNFVGDVCSDCGYDKSTGTTCEHVWTTEWTIDTVDNEYHWHKCIKCNAITDKKPHAYTIVTDSGTNHIRECECKVFYVEDHISSDWIIDTPATATTAGSMHKECTVCKHKMQTEVIPATGEIEPPTPDNPGTIVIIRPAEEEKPAQQPNPSTGANDLVGLAVAAAVAAALGSAALLRKHD